MKSQGGTPPDIEALEQRVIQFGRRLEAERVQIARLEPAYRPAGLWVTSDGEHWQFRARHPRPVQDAC